MVSGSVAQSNRPYEGLSRMKGNFQVRFLEGGGLATARLYSAKGVYRGVPASRHAARGVAMGKMFNL